MFVFCFNHNASGENPPITRIEEAAFACHPDQSYNSNTLNSNQFHGHPNEKLLQSEGVKERRQLRKSSHSSKTGSQHKCSSKKLGSSRSKHEKQKKVEFFLEQTPEKLATVCSCPDSCCAGSLFNNSSCFHTGLPTVWMVDF